MRIVAFIILFLISTSCSEKKESAFSLNGTTENLKNGTLLYLFDAAKEEIIDSAKVHNNTFKLTTQLPNHPMVAVLKNKSNSLYKSLWLENKPMTFNAASHHFNNAVISGSETEIIYNDLNKAIDTLSRKEGKELLMEFIKSNADNILGPYVLSRWYTSWKKEGTEPLYAQLSEEGKNSFYGKKILKYIQLNQNPTIGDKYVDFELKDQYGSQIKLSDLKGKLILLEFWASWCAPCRKDNSNLVDLHNEYKALGFDIFQVSLDDNKEEWLEAIQKDKLQWTNVSDLKSWNNEAGMIYGINLLPSNFLIDEYGTIISRDLRGEALKEKLQEILE